MTYRWFATLAMLSIVPAAQAAAAECTAKSGAGMAALVELYTSEGCNSCPPADEWLRKLPAAGFGPERVVPLALHVDYWDYIGWKDPFASPAFGARQRELAAITRARVVYTPQVLLGGRDYRGWSNRARFADDIRAVNAKPARAEIGLGLREPQPGSFEVRASGSVAGREERAEAVLYVAAYENALSNRVTAGENRGVTLHHDFVVREWWGPIALDAAGGVELVRKVTARGVTNGGVAAFVQSRRTGEVLQALALPACKG
ncbi:MAG: DUF1223 domain-containing protein [Burkholderiales bacterium]